MLRRVQVCLRVSLAQPSFCSCLISPGHCWALILPLLLVFPIPSWFHVSSHSRPLQISVQWALCPLLPSSASETSCLSLDTKQPLLNIYPADCRQRRLLETSAVKSKQSKCHSHSLLVIFPSLRMTLTSFCHPAPHLLRATIRVLIVTWHGATAPSARPQLKRTLRRAGAAPLWRWDNKGSDRWVSLLAGLQPARGKE